MEPIACCRGMLNPAGFGEQVLIAGLAFLPGCRTVAGELRCLKRLDTNRSFSHGKDLARSSCRFVGVGESFLRL